jgi:MFS family permease
LAAGAVAAGRVLAGPRAQEGFAALFLAAAVSTAVSWVFLAQTREPERPAPRADVIPLAPLDLTALGLLRKDVNFLWFMVARWLSQLAMMGMAYYTVYATSELGLTAADVGVATAAFGIAQVAANPIMTGAGDRFGFRWIMAFGMLCAIAASLTALRAESPAALVAVFALGGLANVGAWTVPLAMSTQFGAEDESPAYIGLGNTLVAPSILAAPIVGGLLAQIGGYPWTFVTASVAAAAAAVVLVVRVEDPWKVARGPDAILAAP